MDQNKPIIELARKVLVDHQLAEIWLDTKRASFGNKTPRELVNSSAADRKKVEDYLNGMNAKKTEFEPQEVVAGETHLLSCAQYRVLWLV